jgi:hypothetical protein
LPKGPNQLAERIPIEVGTIQVNFCKNPQFRGSWQEQADPGNAAGTGKGQDNYREHYLLSVTKLLRIFASVKHLPVAKDFFQKEKDR